MYYLNQFCFNLLRVIYFKLICLKFKGYYWVYVEGMLKIESCFVINWSFISGQKVRSCLGLTKLMCWHCSNRWAKCYILYVFFIIELVSLTFQESSSYFWKKVMLLWISLSTIGLLYFFYYHRIHCIPGGMSLNLFSSTSFAL